MNIEIIEQNRKPNPAYTYLASLSSSVSRRTQADALKVIARKLGQPDPFALDWSCLKYEHVSMLQTWLTENYKPATARRYIAAVRGVLRSAWKLGSIDSEQFTRAVSLSPIRGDSTCGRMLTDDEIHQLLETCDASTRGRRDRAIIFLLVGCGLRRAEICSLNLADWDGERLTVMGKGRKQRTAWPAGSVRDALLDWLTVRGTQPGPLFHVITRDAVLEKRMSTTALWNMISTRRQTAQLQPFSVHDLRRTFISDMLDMADLATVATLAGHSNPTVTKRYDKRNESTARDAAALMDSHFKRG